MTTQARSIAIPSGRVRWNVFIIMLVLGCVNYMDRTSLAIAMPYITEEFGIKDATVVGIVHSAFFWAYALMQIPSGVMADKFKTRYIIGIATVIWGIFQSLGAMSHSLVTLSLTRLGLGVAEAPIMPSGAKLMGDWLSPTERGRGSMLLDGGAPLGTALGAIVIAGMIAFFDSWRLAFIVAGVATVIVGVLAFWYIRSYPAEHPNISKEEVDYIESFTGGPSTSSADKFRLSDIKPYLKQRNVMALILGWVCYSSVFYGLMTWLPLYFQQTYGFNIKDMGNAIAIIFIVCFIGQMLGGYIMDKWQQSGTKASTVIHTMLAISAITAGIGLFLCAQSTTPTMAIIFLTIALFPLRWASVYWSIPGLLGAQKAAGTISGTMNFSSNIFAAILPILIGYMIDKTGSYYSAMMFFAFAATGYLICSLSINFDKPMHIET